MSTPFGDFTPLPLALAAPKVKFVSATPIPPAVHWTYIAPHEPRVTTQDTARSLLAANVPSDANEGNLRALFANQLGGARIERVDFDPEDLVGGGPTAKRPHHHNNDSERRGKKRKRHDVEAALHAAEAQLPGPARDLQVLKTGSNAVLVFVDEASQQLALRAVKKAAAAAGVRRGGKVVKWDNGGVLTGQARYDALHKARHPDPDELLASVTSYLLAYQDIEAHQAKEEARRGSAPDADGFITVTKGSRGGLARTEAATLALEKQKKKAEARIGDTFYRFQVREKAKERERELRRQFQKDVRKVEKLKERRKAQKRAG